MPFLLVGSSTTMLIKGDHNHQFHRDSWGANAAMIFESVCNWGIPVIYGTFYVHVDVLSLFRYFDVNMPLFGYMKSVGYLPSGNLT